MMEVTKEDLENCWPYALEYLVDILNGVYELEAAREDIAGLIRSKWDEREKAQQGKE